MAIQKIKLKIGTVYQKEPNGVYYFRYQVNGARKAISLKTRNKQEAVKEAEKHVPLLQATSSEVIAAHVQYARNLATPEKNLLLSQAWEEYEKSPDRATPATVSEALAYKSTFLEFVTWVNDPAVWSAYQHSIFPALEKIFPAQLCNASVRIDCDPVEFFAVTVAGGHCYRVRHYFNFETGQLEPVGQ